MKSPLILKGQPVVQKKQAELSDHIKQLKKRGVVPHLQIIRLAGDSASAAYSKAAQKALHQLGGVAEETLFPDDDSESDFVKVITQFNEAPQVHGILVMQPLPHHISLQKVADTIAPEKDVDGMATVNLGHLLANDKEAMLPSTPQAVLTLLDYYAIDVAGRDVCVVGRSHTVGKPLNVLLLNRHATVTQCHSYTKDLAAHTQRADIVIAAVGVPELLTKDHIKAGATVIDVGYNVVAGKVVGDVLYDEVATKAAAITPVPGGVGSITTISMLEQVVKSCRHQVGVNLHE